MSGLTCNAMAPQYEGIAEVIFTTSRCSVHDASGRPTAPAKRAINVLSISSCCSSRRRPAPSESRTPISRRRVAARPNKRLATFAQAINNSSATAPIVAATMGHASESISPKVRSLMILTPVFRSTSGYPARNCAARTFHSASASGKEMPAFRCPYTIPDGTLRFVRVSRVPSPSRGRAAVGAHRTGILERVPR